MENLTYYILVLYVFPMMFNLIFEYSDKKVTTIEDLMRFWWFHFVPFINLAVMISILYFYFSTYCKVKFWDKIKNIKIK